MHGFQDSQGVNGLDSGVFCSEDRGSFVILDIWGCWGKFGSGVSSESQRSDTETGSMGMR